MHAHPIPSYLSGEKLGPWGIFLQQIDRVTPYLGELGTTTFAGVAPSDAVAMDGAGVVAIHVARP